SSPWRAAASTSTSTPAEPPTTSMAADGLRVPARRRLAGPVCTIRFPSVGRAAGRCDGAVGRSALGGELLDADAHDVGDRGLEGLVGGAVEGGDLTGGGLEAAEAGAA